MLRKNLTALTLGLSLVCGAAAFAAPSTQPTKAYPLNKCVVSDEELGGDMGAPVVYDYKGQEIKFCCGSCLAKFKKDPEKYVKKMNEEAAKQPTTQPTKG